MKFFVFRTRPIITIKTSLYFIADKELVVKAIVHNWHWHWHWHKHFNWCCWWWMGGLWWGRRLPGCAGDVRQGRVWPGLIIRARAHYIISLLSPLSDTCPPATLLHSSGPHQTIGSQLGLLASHRPEVRAERDTAGQVGAEVEISSWHHHHPHHLTSPSLINHISHYVLSSATFRFRLNYLYIRCT